ncbi:glycosyltransferase family 9 protein [Psychroserpens algicola]|uniref:ADP-heptose:LPS heptosyltransferase n=1 Tax=Psychroserpens algicola TaxID=1719034 RepID=A0ABT0HAB9_9FLAO|nr:glycosyltransferase family 9 protein [Psychroserpens algicola]MCK8480787.1 hypothetical protein [Psychroserpens algicola]
MLNIAFLHDVEMDYIGGAELSNKKIIDKAISLGYSVIYDDLTDFEYTKKQLSNCDVAIVNNIVSCDYEFELISHLIKHDIPYVKWEHDYGLCEKRSVYCYVDSKVKNCCNTNRFHHYRNLFVNSKLNVFQSPMHYGYHKRLYGEAVKNHIVLPPPINVEDLSVSEDKQKDHVLFLGDIKFIKGGYELLDYAEAHPEKQITVYGKNRLRREPSKNVSFKDKTNNAEILKVLGKTEYFFFKPRWPEPSGRVAAEAFLSGAKLISNDRVGTFSYDFYPNHLEQGKQLMQNAPNYFWEQVCEALHKTVTTPKFKHALIYKSYGGLGDQFIAIPAVNKLQAVSEQVTVALPNNLINVFKTNTKGLNLIPISTVETIDMSQFDKVINLGNYPKSRRFRNIGVINYETHHRLRQHALKHYIDAIATMHPEADNSYSGFPYFKSDTNTKQPYFTVHPGAGFKPKWWPTERYVELIEVLLKKFPSFQCTVILGPNDPDPEHFKHIDKVTIETGNLDEVAICLSGATFHIGNDSGITHFAGVYNVPSVAFHGLTGPGSWSTLAENREVVWGKPGHCSITCKYDIAIACEHRICLHSISVNRAVSAVYKLLQKSMKSTKNTRIKYIFNPEVLIHKTDQGFTLKMKDKELLLEFKEAAEQLEFEDLVQNDLFEDQIKEANLKPLITALVNEDLIFGIPFKV